YSPLGLEYPNDMKELTAYRNGVTDRIGLRFVEEVTCHSLADHRNSITPYFITLGKPGTFSKLQVRNDLKVGVDTMDARIPVLIAVNHLCIYVEQGTDIDYMLDLC